MSGIEDIARTLDVNTETVAQWAVGGALRVTTTRSGGRGVSDAEFDRFVHVLARSPLAASCRNFGSIQLYVTLQAQAGRHG